MTDQARPRPASLDRQRRHGLLHDGLTAAAAQLGADVLDDFEAGRDVFQHLALVLPDAAEHRAATAWAGAGGLVNQGLARQMRRQRSPNRLAAFARRCRPDHRIGLRRTRSPGIALGSLFFQFADQQLELLDVAIELLRGAAEASAPQHRELHPQLLDMQGLGVDLGIARGDLDVLARQLGL